MSGITHNSVENTVEDMVVGEDNRSGTVLSEMNSQLASAFDNIIRRLGDSLDDRIRNLSAQKKQNILELVQGTVEIAREKAKLAIGQARHSIFEDIGLTPGELRKVLPIASYNSSLMQTLTAEMGCETNEVLAEGQVDELTTKLATSFRGARTATEAHEPPARVPRNERWRLKHPRSIYSGRSSPSCPLSTSVSTVGVCRLEEGSTEVSVANRDSQTWVVNKGQPLGEWSDSCSIRSPEAIDMSGALRNSLEHQDGVGRGPNLMQLVAKGTELIALAGPQNDNQWKRSVDMVLFEEALNQRPPLKNRLRCLLPLRSQQETVGAGFSTVTYEDGKIFTQSAAKRFWMTTMAQYASLLKFTPFKRIDERRTDGVPNIQEYRKKVAPWKEQQRRGGHHPKTGERIPQEIRPPQRSGNKMFKLVPVHREHRYVGQSGPRGRGGEAQTLIAGFE
uniref:Reverse transcriptase domain-containing protein n=1 Tax=Haemonchus contortus TaxID=6289 RepID=A0A7I4YVR2_HAECO